MFQQRFSINIHISTLFFALILSVGGILAWFNYLKISDLLITASDKLFRQIANDVTLDFKSSYLPVAQNINLMAATPLPRMANKQDRLTQIPMMITALRDSPQVAAVEVGYANGDYYIVRAIRSDYMKRQFDAPKDALYMADHIEQKPSGANIERTFINFHGQIISQERLIPTDYDPRTRPWFKEAVSSNRLVATSPYLFYFIGKLGITLSYFDQKSGAVIAADITLEQLSNTISKHHITPSSIILMIDQDRNIVAYEDQTLVVQKAPDGSFTRVHMDKLNKPVLEHFLSIDTGEQTTFHFQDQTWIGTSLPITISEGNLSLLILAPENEVLSEAVNIRNSSTILAALILLISLPITWLLANRVAKPLINLTHEANSIKQLNFRETSNTRSFVLEIDQLSRSVNTMKSTINQFLKLIASVTSEENPTQLINTVTAETRKASTARSVALYLLDDKKETIYRASFNASHSDTTDTKRAKTYEISSQPQCISDAIKDKHTHQQVCHLSSTPNPSLPDELLLHSKLTSAELVTIPLLDRTQNIMGLLVLTFENHDEQTLTLENQNKVSFANALSGFCAESLEKNQLYQEQKALLESFIKLIAGAIDAKSPYTGGHCQRVPELTILLTQAACDVKAEPFKEFTMNDEQWEALHIASWLHDCGKVTTPEYVVDKATRLETLYDRIHEIRTRVEVLKRDQTIIYQIRRAELALKHQLTEEKEAELKSEHEQALESLNEDFYFIAECNSGDHSLDEAAKARLKQISERTWQRTLNDRVGLSWEERKRKQCIPEVDLPVTEQLLSDRPDHLILRETNNTFDENNPWGFKMEVPEYKFNLGELYNLSVSAGTLNNEERFIINDHIIQTIIMLNKLPFPKHLEEVPEIAGCHHEKMDGKGYPRKLSKEQMSIPARIMAIADIFEALTASDRPYKDAKTLSNSLHILNKMSLEGHIDRDLFELFLKSGAYLEYANRYLQTSQIDDVRIEDYFPGHQL